MLNDIGRSWEKLKAHVAICYAPVKTNIKTTINKKQHA